MSRAFAKYLMALSALALFALGIVLTFAPGDVVNIAGGTPTPLLTALAQACGALYLGFAILNWMAKDNLIGGIYSRPVALGNFLHFFVMTMALVKAFSVLPHSAGVVILVVFYVALTVAFGAVLFRHPKIE